MKIEMIEVSEITKAEFNPALRTTDKALHYLLAQIKESGEITPLEIGTDGVLGDGHRRLAVAEKLGIKRIPVIRSKTRTAAEIYLANDGRVTKSTKSAEWLQAVNQGFPLDIVPSSAKSYIRYMYEILDQTDIDNMAASGQSPSIVQIVRMTANHIGATGNETEKKICLWLYNNGIQFATRKAIEGGCPPDVIIDAINEDRPVQIIYQ